ncbi:hypothetical protein Ahy_B05g075709 [Arachis hypogaea]|uniref:MULE transposase domain-containing protein n=1 Tax=Arachis hypogaea TaxID=3818 RepID=A0A444Z1T6_ARAHY|nr:hypothetical protein Ahy_B05g075709 [Arachis hypogaea]
MFVRHTVGNNDKVGITPTSGGHCELSFIEKDVRNYITKEVHTVSELDDAKKFGKYLLRMEEKNQNFFYDLEIEVDHSIKNTFRADARSRIACYYFGDVVSFDITYNTNRYFSILVSVLCETSFDFGYNLGFGSFVGVNHHGYFIFFGCVLMKNEDIQSFKWLFKCWLCCKGGKALKGILIDQCASMQRAIETCMPTTIYR